MLNLFTGRIIVVGFGIIGQAVLPLLLKHLVTDPKRIHVITADDSGFDVAKLYGVSTELCPLTQENYERILRKALKEGDILLNLSVNVSSRALISFCQQHNVLYLDTCIEPWEGLYADPRLTPAERSNYMLREQLLSLREEFSGGPTAVVAHGANPGLVSHFTKKALLNLAADKGMSLSNPQNSQDWAELSYNLGIKVIHIAEKDTQETSIIKKPREFVNTWSIDGFLSEGMQPAELGWGTHEKHFPKEGAYHTSGCKAAIYLNRPGLLTKTRTWTPLAKSFHGFLVTHNESISIANFLTLKKGEDVIYRPTVHYSYHPSSDTVLSIHEFVGNGFEEVHAKRLLREEIAHGIDELGVLLMGDQGITYWYGSQLSIEETRALTPYNNATSLQVAAAVLAGLIWAVENPRKGIVEAEDLDFERILEISSPYLGKVVGEYSDWTPLQNRGHLFSEDLDLSDPWQFKNFLVS